jgi:RimJ/RimL family protein N-acetyltransferase
MSSWLPHPISLAGTLVELRPLGENDFAELEVMASDSRIWEFYSFDGSRPGKMTKVLQAALAEKEKGNQYPFAIFHKKDQRVIGSTRFMDIHPEHRKLEIGGTWLHPEYWKTSVNPECKLLLLTYAFETLKAVRVQLKTAEENIRSQKAIEKIGGVREGLLRNDMIRENNTNRNSVYFSIIESEWNAAKINLQELVKNKL